MAKIIVAMPTRDVTFCVSTNPEVILMHKQGDFEEIHVTTSYWLSGRAVTQPKNSDTKE